MAKQRTMTELKLLKNLINKLQTSLIHKFGGITYQESLLAKEPKTTFTISYPEIITLHSNFIIDDNYYKMAQDQSLEFAKYQCLEKITKKIMEDNLYQITVNNTDYKGATVDMEVRIVKF